MATDPITLWFNPRCSKCRQARALLDEQGVSYAIREYLEQPPTRAEVEDLLAKLGTDDPAVLLRAKEEAYRDNGLADADRAQRLAALLGHPTLLERPIVVRGNRAVVARPPEKLLEILGDR